MVYISEFIGSLIFLLCGYAYMCNVWFAVLPIPNKGAKVDRAYQFIVNLVGSSIGGILAVITVNALFK